MPNYEFECRNCNYNYDRFFSLKDWGKFPIEKIKCDKCKKKTVYKVMSPVGFKIKGWSPGKELARDKHLALAQECMQEAKEKGVTKTEIDEGHGLMADLEKKKGMTPGTISGKRQSGLESRPDGTRGLSRERKAELKKASKLQSSLRKSVRIKK